MAGQLLHCITTITPRARYYSFLPWCVREYTTKVKGTDYDKGLNAWIRNYEKVLALGCIAANNGDRPTGGGVVGNNEAVSKYSATNSEDPISIYEYRPKGSTAWGQYGTSIVNLGCFNEINPSIENEIDEDETESEPTADDITLTPIGELLADAYQSALCGLNPSDSLMVDRPMITIRFAETFAGKGGLDQISLPESDDRKQLLDVFFDGVQSPGASHQLRKESLTLLLVLCEQASQMGESLTWKQFGEAVVYGKSTLDEGLIHWEIPDKLARIQSYWRAFYLHNYMSSALEAMLVALVSQVGESEDGQIRLAEIIEKLESSSILDWYSEHAKVDFPMPFGQMSTISFLETLGLEFDNADCWADGSILDPESWFNEAKIIDILRERKWASISSLNGLSISLILFVTSLLRYRSTQKTDADHWSMNNVADTNLDLCPPLVLLKLEQWDEDWTSRPFADIAHFALSQFVIRQHEYLGYDKGQGSDSMILHASEDVLTRTGDYENVTIGNPRFKNAIGILQDLGLIKIDDNGLTREGERWLEIQLHMMDL